MTVPDTEQPTTSGLSTSVIRSAIPRDDGSSVIQGIPEQDRSVAEQIELPGFVQTFLPGLQVTQNNVYILIIKKKLL